MKKQHRLVILAVLFASLFGFFLPWLVSLLQDNSETRRVETYAVEAISINYDTNLTVAEKLALFSEQFIYISRLENGRYLTESDVNEITSTFFTDALGQTIDFNEAVCYPISAYSKGISS